MERKNIAFSFNTIPHRLYLNAAIVAVFLLTVISISMWTGNTLTMITAIARFERTHTVSRVEAMVAILKFLKDKKQEEMETFQAKMAITQSYNKVFSKLLDMRNTTPDVEFVQILEDTFREADHKTAVIIVNRLKVLYWHPFLKELVANAVGANATGETIKVLVYQIIGAKNEEERTALFMKIEQSEKDFIFHETSFSKRCSDLSNEISMYVNYISVALLIISVGFTGLLTYIIAKTLIVQAKKYAQDLENQIREREQAETEVHRLNAELEQRVDKRTAQLEAANKELEAFCYSVSHDLRAPLRHIDGYVDLLVSRCRDGLSEKGLHYVATIADSARQMGKLIDDLLQFSRTGRTEMSLAVLDMNKIFQEALAILQDNYVGRIIEWEIGKLPSISGDYALLRLVWVNLLGNALKYTGTREVARITVSARENNGEIIFVVADNGVGFDMQYIDKLFGVFQRLHRTEEFEGTGIGLATVHRIIARHGGRVWAEAEPDHGAQFFFSLPNKLENFHA